MQQPSGSPNPAPPQVISPNDSSTWKAVQRILMPFASLRLTIVCFLAAIVIVFVGTLAQVNDDIWKVVRDYFRVDFDRLFTSTFPWIHLSEIFVWVKPQLFFPPAFFPEGAPKFSDSFGFWFPKGWIIGAVMLVNLIAAHTVRFQVQAKGTRLVVGWIVIALGALVTFAVILSGSSAEGLQTDPIISYPTLWWLMESTLFGLCAIAAYAAIVADRRHPERRLLFGGLAMALLISSIFALYGDGSNQATMRILYQVIKATFAGLVLLAGCIAVFKKRAGIVLLHAGIGLMMAYDVIVGVEHVESQMYIVEGQTTPFSRDTRSIELAVVDSSPADDDLITVVDATLLNRSGKTVTDSRLPFKIEVLDYYPNSNLLGPRQPVPEGLPAENPATEGIGRQVRVTPAGGSTGTDTASKVDVPSAYLKLTSNEGTDLGTYLVSAHFDRFESDTDEDDKVTVDGKEYGLSLRFKRIYNDYTVTLKDVQKNDYKGTDKPRDYSSYIELDDPVKGTKFDHHIWMNNPMRYAGKTFYQSGYFQLSDDKEMTALQVVDNAGWMTPYVACMMVVVGMMYHFGLTLLRFLNRRTRETTKLEFVTDSIDEGVLASQKNRWKRLNAAGWWVTAALLLLATGKFAKDMMPSSPKEDQFNLKEFGDLPMWYKGRPMPVDTFARNIMLQLADYQRYSDHEGDPQPAIQWLIDLMVDEDKAREHRVVRIENEEVRKLIGLETRKGFSYSIKELNENIDKIIEQAQLASKTGAKERSLIQRKVIELANRLVFYSFLERTLGTAPELPKSEMPEGMTSAMRLATRAQQYFEYLRGARSAVKQFSDQYGLGPTPLLVPTHLGTEDQKKPNIDELNSRWEPLTIAQIY
ncbi:MAG TPA: cytochrome c biogenesis protein ResB, partial [Planctomicrobium sp.]|nr:cytochrome c biogenesis protein ResB [Planctomicrobium sp.]